MVAGREELHRCNYPVAWSNLSFIICAHSICVVLVWCWHLCFRTWSFFKAFIWNIGWDLQTFLDLLDSSLLHHLLHHHHRLWPRRLFPLKQKCTQGRALKFHHTVWVSSEVNERWQHLCLRCASCGTTRGIRGFELHGRFRWWLK